MQSKKRGEFFHLMRLRRALAFCIACCMSFYGNVGFSAPVQPPNLTDFVQNQPLNLLDLSIPKEIGDIKETFKGQDEKAVFVIQDAHEIPDAQRNIQKIVDFLQTQYGIRLVALEGAASDLDPQIFRSFPDQALLKKVFEQYFDQGELAGGTASAIFNPSPSVYHGVEDWGLYEEGLKHFLDAMEIEESVTKRLEGLFEELKGEKEKHYSKDLLQIDLALQAFHKNVTDLITILEKLEAVQLPEKGSELALLLEEVGRSRENDNSIEMEVKGIADQIRSFLKQNYSAEAKQDLVEFNQKFQEFQTQRITPEAFALFLKGLAMKYRIKIKVSKRLNYLVGNQKRMKDIQGTKLFDDFEKYARSVKESLFQNDEEKKLDARSHQLELMERLAKLELSREDWNEVKEIFNEIQYWNATKNGAAEQNDIAKLLQDMRPQVSFYHNAGKRDHAFIQQVDSLFQKRRAKSVAFIAGGFHAEGVTYTLKSKGISYVLVMPKINRIPDETHYRDHMKGEVSWSDYFEVKDGKVNLFNAFVRGTRDLLLKLSKEERGRLLKEWRDNIIRDLAEKGKLTESSQYTRFIDEVSGEHNKDELISKWEANIINFVDGLHNLHSKGNITEENILGLLQSAFIPAGATGAPLARSELRADLFPHLKAAPKPEIETPVGGERQVRSEARSALWEDVFAGYKISIPNAELKGVDVEGEQEFLRQQQAMIVAAFEEAGIPKGATVHLHLSSDGTKRTYKFSVDLGEKGRKNFELTAKWDGKELSELKFRSYGKGKLDLDQIDTAAFRTVGGIRQLFRDYAGFEIPRYGMVRVAVESEDDKAQVLVLTTTHNGQEAKLKVIIEKGTGAVSVEDYQDLGSFSYDNRPHIFGVSKESASKKASSSPTAPEPSSDENLVSETKAKSVKQPIRGAIGMPLADAATHSKNGQKDLDQIRADIKANSEQVTVGSYQVYIDRDLLSQHLAFGFKTEEDFKKFLTNYFKEQLALYAPPNKELVVAVLDTAENLFGSHVSDGFVAIHRSLYEKLKAFPKTARKLLMIGLSHELFHEAMFMEKRVLIEHYQKQGMSFSDAVKAAQEFIQQNQGNLREALEKLGLWDTVESKMLDQDLEHAEQFALDVNQLVDTGLLEETAPFVSRYREQERSAFSAFMKDHLEVQEEKHGLVPPEHPVHQEIDQIFQKILKAAGLEGEKIKLHIVNSDEVNAYWVTDSGSFFISLGLIKTLERYLKENGKVLTQDMIAWILAHEVRHLVQYLESKDKIAEKETKNRKAVAQQQEYDADVGGLFLAAFAGFNPSASIEVIRFLDAIGDIPFLVDHPKADNRLGEAQKVLQSPDQFLPNTRKTQTSFSEKFQQDPLVHGQTKASEKYEKMMAAKNLDELASQMTSIEDLAFFEEWMMYYYLSLSYGLSFGIAQDPAFQQYMSFLLEANNIGTMLGANVVGQAGRFTYERDWEVPVSIANLFRFFAQTQQDSSSSPIPVLGQDLHLNRQAILDYIDKKIDEDLASLEYAQDSQSERKVEILRMVKKQFRGVLAQTNGRNVQRVTQSQTMQQAFIQRKSFSSREEAEKSVGADWILEVFERNDGSVMVTYMDRQAISENFEHFWEYFEHQYDRETTEQWGNQRAKAESIAMLGLKDWFRKRYGALQMPEMLFDIQSDQHGGLSEDDRSKIEKGRNEFLPIYLRFLAFHFFMNQFGPFAPTRKTTAPAVPHMDSIQARVQALMQKKYGNSMNPKAIDLLARIKYLAMFRGHSADFNTELEEELGKLSESEREQVLKELLAEPPYYLSTMPGQVSSMVDYSSFVGLFQKRFASYYFEIIQKILEKKAATTGLDLGDLQSLFLLRTKLANRLDDDVSKNEGFKKLMEFVLGQLFQHKDAATLDLIISEVGSVDRGPLKEILFQYLMEKHFDKGDYKSKIEVHGRLFPNRSEVRNGQLEILFSTVGYESMDDATKKDFLENFLPLFKTDEKALMGTLEDSKFLHQRLSYDYMMLLKKEGMGLVDLIEKMDAVNAVVTQFDLIVSNQKEWKALSFADARKIVGIVKKSKSGYQTYQEALGSIALTKMKPGIPTFAKTDATRAYGRVKRPSGKVEDAYLYHEAMEDKGDFKEHLSRFVSPAKGQASLFSGMSFEESVQLVLELFPMSKERDEILLALLSLFPSNVDSAQAADLLEALSPLEAKGELPNILSISARPVIREDEIYAYLEMSPFNVIEDANLIDVDKIMAQIESRIPDHLKDRPDIKSGLDALRKQLLSDKEEFRKAAEADRTGATATTGAGFRVAGSSRMMWTNSINNAIYNFAIAHLIQDNPYFDYLNLRDFGYSFNTLSVSARWRAYRSRKDYFLNPSIPIEERLKELTRLFPNETPLRDNLIANLIALEENRLGKFVLKTLFQKGKVTGRPTDFEIMSTEFSADSLTPVQAQALITFYKKMIPLMSDGTRQIVLGRKIFELQKKFFPKIFQDFEQGLQEILSIFPKFSLARDSVLNEFINMGSIRNFDQLNRVRGYILEEQRLTTEAEIVQDAQRNELWNTLNKLPSRKEKADLILWLLSPTRPLPESLKKLATLHHINFDSLPNVILSMTRGERDKFFYDSLRGYNGLFDLDQAAEPDKAKEVFDKFVGELFDSFFTPTELGEATGMMRDIFQSIFTNYSTERRILLFNALLNAFIESRNQRQGRAQKIRTLLEQMGVIGVKVAQYLSEQPGLFKDAPDIPEELKNLKKDAAPFHLRAIFQLLQEAGLLDEVTSLGTRLGAASIKQVYEVLLKDGRSAAAKFLRPAAEKFLQEDIAVLETTMRMMNTKYPEIGLPKGMVEDIRKMILEELSFEREAANAKQFAKNLAARSSQKQGNFTIKVPEIYQDSPYVILEEIVRGITIEDLMLLQADPARLSDKQRQKRQKLEASLTQQELEAYQQYDIQEILKVISQEFFQQAFGEGFFHADLHYGNAMITAKREIYMIDLGATGKTDPAQTQSLLMLIVALELGRAGRVTSILDSFLANPISSNSVAKQELTDLLKSDVSLENKLKKLITLMEKNKLGANKDLAVYLKALASVAPAFESMSDKEKRKLVSSYLTFGSKIKLGTDWVRSFFGGRSELREQVNQTAAAVIDALNPETGEGLKRSEIRQIYELSTSDFDSFTDAILETWANRAKETEAPEEDLNIAQAAMDESGRLINHLRALRESGALPKGTITVGLRLTAQNNTSFLAQFFKVLQSDSQNAEVLAEAEIVKNLPREDVSNLAVRSVKPMDWQRGFRALRSDQDDVPVSLDPQFLAEAMNSMFTGLVLNRSEARLGPTVDDFQDLVAAVSLVELAKISADPQHRSELRRLATNPKAKAEYLKTQLLRRLADLGYPPEMFVPGQNGYLTIEGMIAVAFLETKAKEATARAA